MFGNRTGKVHKELTEAIKRLDFCLEEIRRIAEEKNMMVELQATSVSIGKVKSDLTKLINLSDNIHKLIDKEL